MKIRLKKEKLGIQVKHWENNVGFDDAAKTMGVSEEYDKVIIISTKSDFTHQVYENKNELNSILKNSDLAGRVFIGPLNSTDTEILNSYCYEGAVFFSFSSNKSLAKNCVYLINFFPENEIRTLFNFFPKNSKIALLFPENIYGFSKYLGFLDFLLVN